MTYDKEHYLKELLKDYNYGVHLQNSRNHQEGIIRGTYRRVVGFVSFRSLRFKTVSSRSKVIHLNHFNPYV